MVGKDDSCSFLLEELDLLPFEQKFPWFGGDLQTLRDTFIPNSFSADQGEVVKIGVPPIPGGAAGKGQLLAFLDRPKDPSNVLGLVLLLHGLGGSSRRLGLRRMGLSLLNAGFGVLRLNLRGADPGRHLAGGTYAAECNTDLEPVFIRARQICDLLSKEVKGLRGSLPLFGAGISLGGTILLNACLKKNNAYEKDQFVLDGLVCTSSPLDLEACSASIERPRNSFYQHWLLKRLKRQTLADPFGVTELERELLLAKGKDRSITTIRAFDAAITAPRWGYRDVETYYFEASPLQQLCRINSELPPILFLQALDDPWVPAEAAQRLAARIASRQFSKLQVILTQNGGHNGFHGSYGCWGDVLVRRWLSRLAIKRSS